MRRSFRISKPKPALREGRMIRKNVRERKDKASADITANSSRMLELLLDFPGQCKDALALGKAVSVKMAIPDARNIVCAGVGGSAIGADLVRSYALRELAVPMFISRNYGLPAFVDDRTLLFVSSYSGHGEEAISAYREGRRRKAYIVVFASGGELYDMAKGDSVDRVRLPAGLPPRCALGYSFIPLIILLTRFGLLADKAAAITEMIGHLEGLRSELNLDVPPGDNMAKRLAERFFNKFPVFYTSCDHFDVVATRWRTQLAENSKHLSSTHIFPEMSHNEIDGWQCPTDVLKGFIAVFLRDRGEHEGVAIRMDISKRMLESAGAEVAEIHATGDELLSRMMSLIYTADMTSYYLAALNGVDPSAIDRIEFIKKETARVRKERI